MLGDFVLVADRKTPDATRRRVPVLEFMGMEEEKLQELYSLKLILSNEMT